MFPIRAKRKLAITPYATYILIAINVLVFVWELSLGTGLSGTFRDIALVPCQVGVDLNTILDSFRTMFLHASWVHLIGNMLFLLVFGPHLEQFMGQAWFVAFYLVAGQAANFAHTLSNLGQCAVPGIGGYVPVVGASGAVFGLLGGFLLLYPATRIQMMALFLRLPVGFVDVRAFVMLVYMFLFDFIDALTSLGADTVTTRGVAVWAHVGGFAAGLLLAFLFTAFVRPLPTLDEGLED
ncbi:MAG: rhomboid family intramembrane serine protease [Anaerolineae bacterium]|nr:rhomboid family intramembrane serine protease [Anaerolineae bacterium]